MERRSRLTYERLAHSLERLHSAVDAQFPDPEDTERVQDLRRVINDTLTTARAGMSGATAESPVQLKRELEAHIVDIHERHSTTNGYDDQRKAGIKSIRPTSSNEHPSLSPSTQKTHASRRISHKPEGGKENAKPAITLSNHPLTKTLSAVKKTTITKRPSSKPTGTDSVKKRSFRTTRNKTKPLTPAIAPFTATDEDDRRAAAAALLGLADHSPETSFTSFTTATTSTPSVVVPSTSGRKRARVVYEDDVASSQYALFQEHISSSPPPKRHMLEEGTYASVPRLIGGLSAKRAFMRGVEYAVQLLSKSNSFEVERGEELEAWVRKKLGLSDCLDVDKIMNIGHQVNVDDGEVAQDVVSAGVGEDGIGVEKKGFWDVV